MTAGRSYQNFLSGIICLLFFGCLITLVSCSKKEKWLETDPAFAKYVEAYTSGIVSKTSVIRIQLAADASTTHTVGQPVKETLFSFTPSVKGTAVWLDARTLEFKPEKELLPDQLYEINFKLGKVTRVPDRFQEFRFNIQTIKPAFSVTHFGLRSTGEKNAMFLTGEISTADAEAAEGIKKLLTVSHNRKSYPIIWQHGNGNKTHSFTINNIERSNQENNLILQWDGAPMKIKNKGESTLAVPAIGDFKVLTVMAMNDAQQYASVQFSDPVEVGQDLTGLLTISNQPEPSYTINGSEIKLYAGDKLDGNFTVMINPGIKNKWGKILETVYSANVVFESRLPSVKILGAGNILPSSGKLVLPFDAVNLNAVDISIIKIFESNVPQFLQENDLGGNNELRRVGKPIVQKTLRLDTDQTLDLHRKQRFSLDLDQFLKTEPGAIYRVTIGFRPAYSLYSKTSVDTTESNSDNEEEGYDEDYENYGSGDGKDSDDEFWSRYDNYYPYGYNWQRRDDPTSKSYYNKDRWATRNILASNLGITAKRNANNALTVAISSILTTQPLAGVELQVLNFQLQPIGKVSSGSDGFATIELKQKPYLLIAKKGAERGYLKVDDGSSLALGRFDVSGEEVKNGIKGFIFGERGVWRPGDSLFINCIIEDKTGNLPKDHPIEFKLFTPQGQLYRQEIQSNGPNGFYAFKTSTAHEAPTGNWLVKVKAGGAVFEKRIKVETVMPNRLKINLDFGKDAMLGSSNTQDGNLNAMWLFGSPGKNLKAKIDASLVSAKTSFPTFSGFNFDNPTASFNTQTKVLFEGTLNESGNAPVKPNFELDETAPGMLTARLLVKVFEPGGSFSIDNMSIPYSPYASYAGIKIPEGEKPFDYLLNGKKHEVQLVNVDDKGNLLQAPNEMEVQFYKIQWRWWWEEGGDNLSNFTQNEYNKLIKTETVTLSNGKGKWSFSTTSSDWGRYLILAKDPRSGHTTGAVIYIDEPGWQSRSGMDDASAATMLSFTSNKEKYNVGDDITLTIPSAKNGRLLVSLENGSHVISSFWKETSEGQTKVSFKAEAGMAPNIFATVSLLQPHAQTANDLPIRMYGSIPLLIEDKNTVLYPVISMPDVIRPEQQVSISVSEKNGKEMTYCIAVVDEGLLDLTNFKTPDPHAAFYAREALGVKSFDMFNQVIGAWGGNLERILSIGGDADASGTKQKTANRFKPVVRYFGPFHLAKGKKQVQTFQMPAYIGSVKTMVVAAHKGSYGSTDKVVAVKKPLMVLTTLPRLLAPGERITVPVTVFAMENNIKNVQVSLPSNPWMEVEGAASQTLSFTEPGEQMAYFEVKVKEAIGIATVTASVASGTEKASDKTEISIRNPNPVIDNVQQITLAPGQEWRVSVSPVGIASLSKGSLEISSIPALNLEKRLGYLIEYPHGCIEQTTSAVFPQLYVQQLTNLSDFQKAEIQKNIKIAINKILLFQRPDGGFSYWPGNSETDDWGTNYAGHFLLEAANSGYFVSTDLLTQWKSYQRSKANDWAPSTRNFYGGDLSQAYRLYTLALAKAPELGAMNRLKEFKYLSPEAKWRLAAAYKLYGQDNTALDLISGLPVSFDTRPTSGISFGSDLRDQAMVLETLTLMGRRDKASQLVTSIAARLSESNWYSTQTTAYALLAIAKFCGKNPSGAKIMAAISINGTTSSINDNSYLRQLPVDMKKGNVPISISNKGNNTLYLKLMSRGQPLTGDSIKAVNNPSTLGMTVSYITQNGNPIDISRINQGTDFVAKVTITNPGKRGNYTQMALSQFFPGGWEILNARMTDGAGAFTSSASEYQDTRDDKVFTYFNIGANKTLVYYIQLNAAYLGRYYLPATHCMAMYDNSIQASNSGRWIEVIK